MSDMVLVIATHCWEGWMKCVQSWRDNSTSPHTYHTVMRDTVLHAYQKGVEDTTEPILGFIHDDLEILEDKWDERVLKQFEDPQVGLVGFAGALGHGRPEMYTKPFDIANMVRLHFYSNMKTAEQHGHRFNGECDVAVLDGLALIVRRSILERAGGWPLHEPYGFWLYSEWLCCEVRRQGLRIRLVGVACDHHGGKTSAIAGVQDDYTLAHRYLYENNRDVLPYMVERT